MNKQQRSPFGGAVEYPQTPDRQEENIAEKVAVVPVHTALPGRARVHVSALTGSPAHEHLLDHGLAVFPGVSSAKANHLTGNVLLHFDAAAISLAEIIDRIVALISGDIKLAEDDSALAGEAPWHRRDPDEVAAALETSVASGLADIEVRERLGKSGHNVLPRLAARSPLAILTAQFQSVPVAMLGGAAVLSLATGALIEAAAILGVVIANAAIGFQTESRAERTITSLSSRGPRTTQVIRNGCPKSVTSETIVPGDVLVLRRGMIVPADARLATVRDLTVSEATLTGESMPATKAVDTLAEANVPLSSRTNMVYRGTVVTGGSGTAIVVATGPSTEAGRIGRLVGSSATPETPMQRQLGALGSSLVWPVLAASGAILGIGWLRGIGLLQMVRSALATAVAAVPEGLPMVATTTLAFGVEALQKRDIHVRRLHALEALAVVKVICFDKTGTLTIGQMSVAGVAVGERLCDLEQGRLFDRAGRMRDARADERVQKLLAISCLCNDVEIEESDGALRLDGSGTESALVQAAIGLGIDVEALRRRFRRLSTQHRTESYRFMATSHASDGGLLLMVKGSPAEVLERCRFEMTPRGGRHRLTAGRRAAIERRNEEMADRALRVLGFAYREAETRPSSGPDIPIEDLTWVGLAGMADPVRPGVNALMRKLHRAGVQTIMLTGDQSATARAVAERIGLDGRGEIEVIDGAQLETMSAAEIAEAARRAQAFSRVSPAQKLEIVRALQASGTVVAMVGDGMNDSPALKAANVGIGFRRDGADAAREIAHVFMAGDELDELLAAIETGRKIHTNVRKAIHYILSTNSSEILLMLAGAALGFGEALSPLQLLWINLVSDVLPGIGLALEPAAPDIMEAPPPGADEPIVGESDFWALASEAAILGAGAFAGGIYGAARHGTGSPRSGMLVFTSLVLSQLLHALTCRSPTRGLFDSEPLPPNGTLNGILAGSIGAQAALLLVPRIRRLLGVELLDPVDAAVALAFGTLPFIIGELRKSAIPSPRKAR